MGEGARHPSRWGATPRKEWGCPLPRTRNPAQNCYKEGWGERRSQGNQRGPGNPSVSGSFSLSPQELGLGRRGPSRTEPGQRPSARPPPPPLGRKWQERPAPPPHPQLEQPRRRDSFTAWGRRGPSPEQTGPVRPQPRLKGSAAPGPGAPRGAAEAPLLRTGSALRAVRKPASHRTQHGAGQEMGRCWRDPEKERWTLE